MKGLNLFMAFTLSLTNSAYGTSLLIQFNYGLKTGGPLAMLWGWVIFGFFTIFQSLATAEICSAYPAEGGSYFWTGVLASPKYAPILSYLTGWTYLLASMTAGASFAYSIPIILSGVTDYTSGYEWSEYTKVFVTICILAMIALKGMLRIDYQGYFHDVAGVV